MNFEYVIVQAGGKGTRMGHLTRNKPKALVPIDNLPMIFHLFRKYSDKKFIIIGDYKFEVLASYLKSFATVDYKLINAQGKTGTCSGIKQALEHIEANKSFMLIWSDLVLPKNFSVDNYSNGNYVGISKGFPCRWSYSDNQFNEISSKENGVAGLFLFENKHLLAGIPEEGEFVRWLKGKNINFDTISLYGTNEYGILESYNKLQVMKCRPFNKLTVGNGYIVKEGIDEQGKSLAIKESQWYDKVKDYNFTNLPKIYSLVPLKMELIEGKNIYEYDSISFDNKKQILIQIIDCLKSLHKIGKITSDEKNFYEAYIGKTLTRLKVVRDLVPFAKNEFIKINGRQYKNVLFFFDVLETKLRKYFPSEFVFLHGDCTFSNIMLNKNGTPVLIDPRGYFGNIQFFGDSAYDWAKLYYSLIGNYDQFNLKRFDLNIKENEVEFIIQSSNWEDCKELFFQLVGDEICEEQMDLIHTIIWLSLTTYAWQDYDSICGAFYNGVILAENLI